MKSPTADVQEAIGSLDEQTLVKQHKMPKKRAQEVVTKARSQKRKKLAELDSNKNLTMTFNKVQLLFKKLQKIQAQGSVNFVPSSSKHKRASATMLKESKI